MDFADLIQPSIELAENGLIVNETFAGVVSDKYDLVFENGFDFLNEGFAWEVGDLFTNPDLAETYKHLQKTGPSDFYEGELAEKIDAFMSEFKFHKLTSLETYLLRRICSVHFSSFYPLLLFGFFYTQGMSV